MAYEFVIYEKAPPLAKITLNRPEKLNPLSNPLRDDLEKALAEAENDADVSVIIIKGSGRAFSAGYDLIRHDFNPQDRSGPGKDRPDPEKRPAVDAMHLEPAEARHRSGPWVLHGRRQ